MKQTIILLIIFSIFTFSCKEEFSINRDIEDDPSITDMSGNWQVVSFENYIDNKQNWKTGIGCDIILNFNKDNNPYPFTGKAISKNIYGFYSNASGRALANFSIFSDQTGSVKASCQECYDTFIDALPQVNEFKINASQLRFYFDKGNQSITFDRVEGD